LGCAFCAAAAPASPPAEPSFFGGLPLLAAEGITDARFGSCRPRPEQWPLVFKSILFACRIANNRVRHLPDPIDVPNSLLYTSGNNRGNGSYYVMHTLVLSKARCTCAFWSVDQILFSRPAPSLESSVCVLTNIFISSFPSSKQEAEGFCDITIGWSASVTFPAALAAPALVLQQPLPPPLALHPLPPVFPPTSLAPLLSAGHRSSGCPLGQACHALLLRRAAHKVDEHYVI